MGITMFAISGAFIALSSGVMAFGMLAFGRARLHTLWGIFCLVVLVWGVGIFFIGFTPDPNIAALWWRVLHVDVAFMPVVFLHFVYVFLKRKAGSILFTFYAGATLLSILALFSSLLIADVRFVFGEFYYASPPGPLYWIYMLWYFALIAYSHNLLYRQLYNPATTKSEKDQIHYFFLASAIGFTGASICFLPIYSIDIYPITNFAVVAYPLIMGYAIFRYKLFDVRAVAAQGLILLLWIFLGARLVLSTTSNDFLLNGLLLVAVIIFGIYLLLSIHKELSQRTLIEQQKNELEKVNDKLKEVDQLKSEFLSIASHQLRAPITAIRGYASLILEGDYGDAPEKMREPIGRIGESARGMANAIEDYLNISRIEQGKMKYEKSTFDLADVAKKTVEEMRTVAERRGLALALESGSDVMVTADVGKIKQVISNLIDNAIKYTEKGSVKVTVDSRQSAVDSKSNTARVTVSDTGIGIAREEIAGLFEKFTRARGANKVNTTGTGLGLYVAKQLVEGHGGKIWAESDGPGKGSRFIVELPI